MPTVALPNGSRVRFPDGMGASEMQAEIEKAFPEFRAKPAQDIPSVLSQTPATVTETSPVTGQIPATLAPSDKIMPVPTTESAAIEAQQTEASKIPAEIGAAPAEIPRFGAKGSLARGASEVLSGVGEFVLNKPEEFLASIYPPTQMAVVLRYGPGIVKDFAVNTWKGLRGDDEALANAAVTATMIGVPLFRKSMKDLGEQIKVSPEVDLAARKNLSIRDASAELAVKDPITEIDDAIKESDTALQSIVAPKGDENAISQRSPTEVPVEVPPGHSEAVGAQVREQTAAKEVPQETKEVASKPPPVESGTAPQTEAPAEPTVSEATRPGAQPPGEAPAISQPTTDVTKTQGESGPGIIGMGGAAADEIPAGGNPDIYGVAARVRAERAQAGQVADVPPGEGIGWEESVARGRQLMLAGADPEVSLKTFEETKKLSSEDMALVRAKGEQLALNSRRTEEEFGTDSPEFRAAFKALSDWDKRTKQMQTEWHKIGEAQQGETDIDTGSFTGLQRAYTENTGEEFTPDQATIAKQKAKSVKDATAAEEEARQKLLDFARKSIEDQADDQQVAAAWKLAKSYIDQGLDNFDDIRNKIATDMGISTDQATALLGKNKTAKALTDDLWRKQQTARQVRNQAKLWLMDTAMPGYLRAMNSVPRTMFTLKVGFHGTVALGTHAPMVAFQPRFWGAYVQDFAKMYRMVGSPTPGGQAIGQAYYEMQVQDLLRRPNYVTARRAGLVNDPFTYEDYNSPDTTKYFGKITTMGNRGYAVLKILRQDMFDQMWDKLPQTAKTPEMAQAIADGLNHATGVVKGRAPAGTNIALFAPRLEASRVMWLAGDPLRAAKTILDWKKASDAEKAFAINQIKEKAWVAGTMFSALAINQGFLSAVGSDQKINGLPEEMGGSGFDPFRSDFLKFKAAGMNIGYGNAMLSMARLPVQLYKIRSSDGGKLKNLVFPDEDTYTLLGKYARSQLSPFASLATELWLKADYANRPLPNSTRPVPKRLRNEGVGPYTWPEFLSEQVLPIPAEEAVKEVWKTGLGMSDEQVKQLGKAMATIAVMSATGARMTDDYDLSANQVLNKNRTYP